MKELLNEYDESIVLKAKNVRAIIVDVDGVLTDGGIIYDNEGNEFKKFNVKDGQIIKHLKNHNILIGAITGRDSKVVQRRCNELRFDFHHHGVKDKWALYQSIKQEYELEDEEVAYLGDDIIDLGILPLCGLGVCPSDAKFYVKDHAAMIAKSAGGQGVLREVADLILASKGFLESIIADYLPKKF